jgi:hypothetical protein
MDECFAVLELYCQEETAVYVLGRMPRPVPLLPSHGLVRYCAVKSLRLTDLATTLPQIGFINSTK